MYHLRAIFSQDGYHGKYEDIENFGSYWYDDPATKTNGGFDFKDKHGFILVDGNCLYQGFDTTR